MANILANAKYLAPLNLAYDKACDLKLAGSKPPHHVKMVRQSSCLTTLLKEKITFSEESSGAFAFSAKDARLQGERLFFTVIF